MWTTPISRTSSPDTDSTGSPIIWAWYLNQIKGEAAKPVLLGEPNTEAAFVLDHWKLDKPEIISTVDADQPVVIVDTNNPAELPDAAYPGVALLYHELEFGNGGRAGDAYYVTARSADRLTGIAAWLFFQSAVNIGMNLKLLPATGLPLPFVSYGGSSFITLMLGIGLVESVAMRQKKLEFD